MSLIKINKSSVYLLLSHERFCGFAIEIGLAVPLTKNTTTKVTPEIRKPPAVVLISFLNDIDFLVTWSNICSIGY